MDYYSRRRHPHPYPFFAGLVALTLAPVWPVAAAAKTTAPKPPATGDPIKLFPAPDLDGQSVDVASLVHGKVALIAMWASWCQPCISEIPQLRKLATAYRDRGLVVVGVGLQQGEDTPAKQTDVAARRLVNYQLLFDAKREYQDAYDLKALPFSILVGADGKIRWQGAALPLDLDARIQALIAEIPKAAGPGG